MPNPVGVHDLRSDTVTQPTPGMRAAMAEAAVGDDCYGDDPTVVELERRVAQLLGKPAAVFVASGTMANQLAVSLHCNPGDTIATHFGAHVRIHEDASAAAISGAQIMPLGSMLGYDLAQLQALCAEESCDWPPVRLVWLENTNGVGGGVIWPIEQLREIADWARAEGRAVHIDGARLWNASVATGTPLRSFGALADSVSVCLSKGLGAPVGSLLCGDEDFIERARTKKHALGGGFRQAGILAAAGLFALDHNVERLADDHRRARRLAEAIADLDVWQVRTPDTNVVVAEVAPPWETAESLCAPLRNAGVLCYPNVYREVRFVLHLGIDDHALDDIAVRVREALSGLTS